MPIHTLNPLLYKTQKKPQSAWRGPYLSEWDSFCDITYPYEILEAVANATILGETLRPNYNNCASEPPKLHKNK